MRLWKNVEATREGKYLVVRRDGTIPDWPHFVLGARDPAVPAALFAYAEEAKKLGYDPDFVADVRRLVDEFRQYRERHGQGDAGAPPHRKDDPATIAKMRGEMYILNPEVEKVAKIVYEAMRTATKEKTPAWVEGGNAIAQDEARSTARQILALTPRAL